MNVKNLKKMRKQKILIESKNKSQKYQRAALKLSPQASKYIESDLLFLSVSIGTLPFSSSPLQFFSHCWVSNPENKIFPLSCNSLLNIQAWLVRSRSSKIRLRVYQPPKFETHIRCVAHDIAELQYSPVKSKTMALQNPRSAS